MAAPSAAAVSSLEDGRKQALHALVSSLAPSEARNGKLTGVQMEALTAKLDQILGNSSDEGSAVQRDEKGQLLNEEGLPIVEITEPMSDSAPPSSAPEGFTEEEESQFVPMHKLSDIQRSQRRERANRILDMLEAEEEQSARAAAEREHAQPSELSQEQRLADAQAEAARRLAAREMQKRMGKALLKNFAEQREQEEKARRADERREEEARSVMPSPARIKPRKSVSFANVPDVDKVTPKSKPSAAWGDVSVNAFKAGMPKVTLKSELLSNQPMKLDVVERIPGKQQESTDREERDSDDESIPDVLDADADEDDEDDEETPPLDGDFDDSDVSSKSDLDPDDDEFDFDQASVHREVALEYLRLRETIGAEAHQAMTAHSHVGENEWDKPEVPLEATLTAKPPKPGISRFKADRQNKWAATRTEQSLSLGASVLPKDRSESLQKAVRTGKLADGKLIGPADDSASEGEGDEKRTQTIEMLKAGLTVNTSPEHLAVPQQSRNKGSSPASPLIPALSPGSAPPPSASRLLAEKATYKKPDQTVPGLSKLTTSTSTPLNSSVIERSTTSTSPSLVSSGSKGSNNRTPFNKPPTAIAVPQKLPSQSAAQSTRSAFATPKVTPDPAVLNTLVIDSPSFPPPSSSSSREGFQSTTLVSEVRETVRGPGRGEPPVSSQASAPTRISRFKAERM